MLTFDFTIIDDPKKVKIVQGSVSPRPIAWISSHNKNGIVNLAPFSYFQMLTSSPFSFIFEVRWQNERHANQYFR